MLPKKLLSILIILICFFGAIYVFSSVRLNSSSSLILEEARGGFNLISSYGSSLIGVSTNSDESFSIWVYDWITKEFNVLATTQHRPDILEGATREILAWGEELDDTDGSYARYFSVRPGDENPVRLSFLEAYQSSRPSPYFYVWAGLIRGSNFLIANGKDFDQTYSEYSIWNLATTERQTLVLDEPREIISFSPVLGDDEEFFLIGEAQLYGQNFYFRLMSLAPFETVTETAWTDYAFPIVAGSSPDEAVFLSGYVSANLIKIEEQDSQMSLKLSVIGDIPETHKWYFSLRKALSDAMKNAKEDGVLTAPGAFTPNANIDERYWRNGFFFWRTIDPPYIKIARDGEDTSTISETVSLKIDPEFSFLPSEDGTTLIVQSAPDSFQLYLVEFPKLTFYKEFKLSYDSISKALSLTDSINK